MKASTGKRKLLAILSGDVVDYSRLMATDEDATIETLERHRDLIGATVAANSGRLVDFPGDNFLATFGSAINAVQWTWFMSAPRCSVLPLPKGTARFISQWFVLRLIGACASRLRVGRGSRLY